MRITLQPRLKKFVEKQVKAGCYQSTDAVLAAGLTRLMQDEQSFDFAPGELQTLVDEGEADLARGDAFALEQVRAHFRGKARAGGRPQPMRRPK